MGDEEDFDALVEKARVLAAATGRSEEDVLADLLDDGILNESNKEKRDLVSELKEAAALITTVQSINKEVSENKVLNGGGNSTKVEVDTTLEGDIVDRAIASAQRKAENLKKLALVIAPLFLLLTGGSMEMFGVTNLVGDDEEHDMHPPPYEPIWGCMDPAAENYDMYAEENDGSCYYDEPEPEPEPEPQHCGEVKTTRQAELHPVDGGPNNSLAVSWWFEHTKYNDPCGVDIEFMLSLYHEGAYQNTVEFNQNPRFTVRDHEQQVTLEPELFTDLGDGNWSVEVRWRYVNGQEDCCEMTNIVYVGEPEEPENCDPYFWDAMAIRETDDYNHTVIVIVWDADFGCDMQDEIVIEFEIFDNNETWIDYFTVTYQTYYMDGDAKEVEWNMSEHGEFLSVNVQLRLVYQGVDYEVRMERDV